MFSVASLIYGWDNQLNTAQALLADLTDEHMVLRPGKAMNHPAWILGHVSIYHPVVVDLLAGRPLVDVKDDRLYGFQGQGPVDDLSVYGTRDSIVQRFVDGHEQVAQALLAAKPQAFQQKPTLERWAKTYPTVEFMLPDLLLTHESHHIGQISIWRRAAGLPPVTIPRKAIRPGLIS
jgi:hypothetical protein